MAVTNWITETSVDAATGRTLVTITVAGPQSERYQQSWLSDAAVPAAPSGAGVSSAPGIAQSNPAVATESGIAGPLLAAAVKAKTVAPSATPVRIVKPQAGQSGQGNR